MSPEMKNFLSTFYNIFSLTANQIILETYLKLSHDPVDTA